MNAIIGLLKRPYLIVWLKGDLRRLNAIKRKGAFSQTQPFLIPPDVFHERHMSYASQRLSYHRQKNNKA